MEAIRPTETFVITYKTITETLENKFILVQVDIPYLFYIFQRKLDLKYANVLRHVPKMIFAFNTFYVHT
jgi:hypothetical protein